jgi:hypothetical protein
MGPEARVGFGVDTEICEVLDTPSLLLVVMFTLSGFCCTVPLVKIGDVKKADLLSEVRGMMPMPIMTTVAMIATSFHLYVKRIRYSSHCLLITRFVHLKIN